MTNEERIANARKHVDFLWGEVEYWLKKDGKDSQMVTIWRSRWVAAKDMYELLTGENYN